MFDVNEITNHLPIEFQSMVSTMYHISDSDRKYKEIKNSEKSKAVFSFGNINFFEW